MSHRLEKSLRILRDGACALAFAHASFAMAQTVALPRFSLGDPFARSLPALVADRAMNRDDAEALRASVGLGDCRPGDRTAAHLAFTDWSSVGQACYARIVRRDAMRADERFRRDPSSSRRVDAAWHHAKWGSLVRGMEMRVLDRTINAAANNSRVMRTLLGGKLDLNFSMGSLAEWNQDPVLEPRPVYSLKVSDPDGSGAADPNALRLAAAGMPSGIPADALRPQPIDRRMFAGANARREIIETWPARPPAFLPGDQALLNTEPEGPVDNLFRSAKRRLGLNHKPFDKYALKVERVTAGGQNVLVRFEEANGFVFFQVGRATSPLQTRSWGLRLPYYKHALMWERPAPRSRPQVSYSYFVSETAKASVTYNMQDGMPRAAMIFDL